MDEIIEIIEKEINVLVYYDAHPEQPNTLIKSVFDAKKLKDNIGSVQSNANNMFSSKMSVLSRGNKVVIDRTHLLSLIGLGFDLSYAPLYNIDLFNTNLSYANLSHADLAFANLSYANLSNANLTYAVLNNANLSYANLVNANLSYVDLFNANLSYANLSTTDLSNASLTYSDLSNANLYYARLVDANFSSATGLDANINIALTDVNKNPNGDGSIWTLTWTDSLTYSCDPSTGLFTLAS